MEQNPLTPPQSDNLQFPSDMNCGDEIEGIEQSPLPADVEEIEGIEQSSLPADVEVEFSSLTIEEMESRLEVGQPMQNELVAYGLYCIYAHAKGFSVRKGGIDRFNDGSGLRRARDFVCSCEGLKDEKRSRLNVPVYIRPTLRCNCKAKLRVARLKGQNWRITAFRKVHNHDMFPPGQTHLLRSARHMSPEMEKCFEAMIKCGIPVTRAKEFLQNLSQGKEKVGFTQEDTQHPLSRANKQSKIENEDVAQLIQHFISMSNKEPCFHWNVEWDENNRPMNIFFRDYRCSIDYEYFGDVLLVDSTNRTNKYNLICCPFLGINHHMQNVTFGYAFMSDESESSFEWMFRAFLESMGGKQPDTIFTDQCEAMINAVGTVFSNSHHRFCHWHINQSVPSHFGKLNGDSNFKKLWNKCMTDCETEEEFEHTWKLMMDGYDIEDKYWFDYMYDLRHKWATAFTSHKFCAGLMTASRKEGANATSKRKFGGTTSSSLYDCVIAFEKIQESWRMDEKEKDTCNHHGRLSLGQNPWLIQAAEVYTPEIFTLFQDQLRESLDFAVTGHEVLGTCLVNLILKSRWGKSKVFKVQFDSQKLSVNCSCQKFETFGILCCHALKVFDRINMHSIPEMYIKRRWTKTARRACHRRTIGENGSDNGASNMMFVHQMMREAYELAYRAKSHEETRCILMESLEDAKSKLDAWFEKLSLDNSTVADDLDADEDSPNA